jgi:hypothetical protein
VNLLIVVTKPSVAQESDTCFVSRSWVDLQASLDSRGNASEFASKIGGIAEEQDIKAIRLLHLKIP